MLTIVDYIGHNDGNGKLVGHPLKVIKEYASLLSPLTKISIAAPQIYRDSFNGFENCTINYLPNQISVFSKHKLRNFIKKLHNLKKVFASNEGIHWFINVDYSLFFYLKEFCDNLDNVWITLCYNPLIGKNSSRKKVIEFVLNRVGLVVVTNKNLIEEIPGKTFFMPDYYYKDDVYKKYQNYTKIERMVCLGTMGETKNLEGLIHSISKTNYPLIIKGNFSQHPERFKRLKFLAQKCQNISIENNFVSYDEYYQLIASSKYVVLPYDMNLYNERTSGILLETIFLGSIPVAPTQLLNYNSIQGIGYIHIDDLPLLINNDKQDNEILNSNHNLINLEFSQEAIRIRIREFL